MSAITISDVVPRIRELPSLPIVILDLLQTIDQDSIDVKSLAERVSRDQALAAKTLRLANSSFYGMSRKVTTIPQAISILGFETVRTLITAAAVIDHLFANTPGKFNFTAFWRHALGTAVCARTLAHTMHFNQEHAFVAGLLHDIGRLVLATFFSGKYEEVMAYRHRHDCYLFEAERQVLEIDHAVVGEILAKEWKFPEAMQKAIAHHHHPQVQDKDSLSAIVHVSDVLAHALDLSGNEDDLVPPLSDAVWNSLSLRESLVMRVLKEADTQFSEASRILSND